MSEAPELAIIGGSGIYEMPGLQDVHTVEPATPFGKPSAPIVVGSLEGKRIAFLARHGLGHHISPTEVNYRANVYALKTLGARRVVSISACGSLREDYAPGHIVVPDQLFDHTSQRERSFFGDGLVAHIDVADPFCPELSSHLYQALGQTGATLHRGGAFITIEGPRFSTKVESHTYRSWGMSLIGMTTSPEAFLAREAEMCYTVMAHVTDFDVWHTSESPVTVEMVVQTLNANTRTAQEAIRFLIRRLDNKFTCACGHSLRTALITSPASVPARTKKTLHLLVGKYLD